MTTTYRKKENERTFVGLQEGEMMARITITKEPSERGIKQGKIVMLSITDQAGILIKFEGGDFTHISAARRVNETQKFYTNIIKKYN